ncbi:hypothetical protein AYO44_13615 [Planctomycetaceae bacterium SCGC AG-212-F19]|nr:hypothetical protein AYO44_13615 [Planctomycetaceae bacterium SCGC AG-212-F19]
MLPAPAEQVSHDLPAYDPDEPLAKTFSLAKSADALDAMAAYWMRKSEAAPKGSYPQSQHYCGTCHANFAYMMARPLLLKEKPTSLLAQTRRWMEKQVVDLDCAKRSENSGKWHFPGAGPTLAAGLVFHDLHTGEGLRPTTRAALTKMWTVRQPPEKGHGYGLWFSPGFCYDLSSPELDGYYTAALAAVAVGAAPDGYACGDDAKRELERFRQNFLRVFGESRVSLHAQALGLWGSCRLDGLLSATQRDVIVRSLLAAQCSDGGWCLAKIAGRPEWRGNDTGKGDGYATGLVVFVLRQAGLPAERPEIARGMTWLKTHQRASGCWFTPNADRASTVAGVGTHDLAILNLGTAFAVMALQTPEGQPQK